MVDFEWELWKFKWCNQFMWVFLINMYDINTNTSSDRVEFYCVPLLHNNSNIFRLDKWHKNSFCWSGSTIDWMIEMGWFFCLMITWLLYFDGYRWSAEGNFFLKSSFDIPQQKKNSGEQIDSGYLVWIQRSEQNSEWCLSEIIGLIRFSFIIWCMLFTPEESLKDLQDLLFYGRGNKIGQSSTEEQAPVSQLVLQDRVPPFSQITSSQLDPLTHSLRLL